MLSIVSIANLWKLYSAWSKIKSTITKTSGMGQFSIAVSVQRDIDAEQRQQSELRSVRDDPRVRGDKNQVDMLGEDYEKSLKGEAELKALLRGLHARAEAFAQMAEKMDQLIEAGDLTHTKK